MNCCLLYTSEDFNRDVLLYRADAEFLLKDYNAAIHTYDLLLEMKDVYKRQFYACHALLKRISTSWGLLFRRMLIEWVPSPRLTIIRFPSRSKSPAHQGKKNWYWGVMTPPSPGIRMVPP